MSDGRGSAGNLVGHANGGAEDYFRLLFETMRDGVLVADLGSGMFVVGNPAICRMLGYDRSEIPTLGHADIHPPESLPLVKSLIDRQLTGEEPVAPDVPVRRRDGTVFYADIHSVAFSFEGKACILGIFRDVTARRFAALERERLLAAEQEARIRAETAVKARDEFLSVAAHELKTPLAALRIVAEAMAKKRETMCGRPELVLKSVETIDRQVQRLVRLVNALLDITRIQTGRFELNRRSVDLATTLRGVLSRLEPSLEQSGCVVRLDLPGMLLAECDRDRMEQVFENLLSNAMKFAPRHPIEVCGREDEGGRTVRIEIRDHGPGIAVDNRAHIFELYDRGDVGLHAGGLGIGLFVCRRILEAHHGSIVVRNADDGGAVFSLVIPAV